jgi:hypothetical protein
MDHDVMKIDMELTFKDCPVCDYSDGFHSMFQKEGAQRFITSIFNISCSAFDILFMNRHQIGRTF